MTEADQSIRIGIEREGGRVVLSLRSPEAAVTLGARTQFFASVVASLFHLCGDDDHLDHAESFIRGQLEIHAREKPST